MNNHSTRKSLALPPNLYPGCRLVDKETGEEFTVHNVGFFVRYGNEHATGDVRSDELFKIFETLPPVEGEMQRNGASLQDEEDAEFESFVYREHYATSASPLSTIEYLAKNDAGAYVLPELNLLKKAWNAGVASTWANAPDMGEPTDNASDSNPPRPA